MINNAAIIDCFKNIIGFEQNTNPELMNIDADLLISESGIKVQQIHPLLTLDNLQNCAKTTKAGFNNHLRSLRNASILKLVNNLYAKKQANFNSKQLISDVRLYEGTGNFNDKVVKQGRFVGLRVRLKESDLSLLLSLIGLQFDTAQTVTIYVYQSSISEPVKTFELQYDKPSSFLWKQIEQLTLPEVKGGSYIIGYYEDDIQGQAIQRHQVFSKMPSCSSCNMVNFGYYQKWFRHLAVTPIFVNVEYLNADKTKWEHQHENEIDEANFGLNLSLSIVCDMSRLFCQNRSIFTHALSLQIAAELLNSILYSGRDNQTQSKASQLAYSALGDNTNPGILAQLETAMKGLDFSTSGLNSVCLPCSDNAQRLNYKSVY